ncbi:hypothetical protein LTR50_000438 [Elasticomyces elasticus]|nr:hypothetical protein LTR50_000438 [Elasticomyces elasticus]
MALTMNTNSHGLPISEAFYEARQAAQAYLDSRLTAPEASSKRAFNVPVIDISPSFSSSLADRQLVAAQIRDACTNSGFFHIVGHGVAPEKREAVLRQAARFFKTLSSEQKEVLHVRNSRYMRGWEPADYTYVNPADWDASNGQAAPLETKEAFNWGYQKELDPTGGDGKYVELDGTAVNGNVWPSEDDLPGFFDEIKQYYGEVLHLARHMFRLFA